MKTPPLFFMLMMLAVFLVLLPKSPRIAESTTTVTAPYVNPHGQQDKYDALLSRVSALERRLDTLQSQGYFTGADVEKDEEELTWVIRLRQEVQVLRDRVAVLEKK